MACIELYATGKNSLSHRKAKIWLPVAVKKNSRHTDQIPLKLSPVSERPAYLRQNYLCFSLLHLWVREFSHKSTTSDRPWMPTVQNSSQYKMLNGQLSRVPWPGNLWMPSTFQPACWALQQPHKHSHSLQPAIHTQLAHHYIQYALSTLSVFLKFFYFFMSKRIFSKYRTATSKHCQATCPQPH